jgi:hypothetical protein
VAVPKRSRDEVLNDESAHAVPNQEDRPLGTPLPEECGKLITAILNRGKTLSEVRLQQLSRIAKGEKLKGTALQVSVDFQPIEEILPAARIAIEAVNEDDGGTWHWVSFYRKRSDSSSERVGSGIARAKSPLP